MRRHPENSKAGKPIGKRIFTLKELAQRDFAKSPNELADAAAPQFNLVNIQEDLLNASSHKNEENEDPVNTLNPLIQKSSVTEEESPETKNLLHKNDISLSIETVNHLIDKEISKIAQLLNLEICELQAWINLQAMVPRHTLITLLRIANQYQLDPLKEEVALALYDDCHWQAYITVEGYSKVLNCHPAFDGIAFAESPECANGIPIWMECTIYRKDRSLPIVIREYFEEVKGEQTIWQKMPRRMLRHRVMQQCARLAIT